LYSCLCLIRISRTPYWNRKDWKSKAIMDHFFNIPKLEQVAKLFAQCQFASLDLLADALAAVRRDFSRTPRVHEDTCNFNRFCEIADLA